MMQVKAAIQEEEQMKFPLLTIDGTKSDSITSQIN